MFNMTRVVN